MNEKKEKRNNINDFNFIKCLENKMHYNSLIKLRSKNLIANFPFLPFNYLLILFNNLINPLI
jgi:hypothetical protein